VVRTFVITAFGGKGPAGAERPDRGILASLSAIDAHQGRQKPRLLRERPSRTPSGLE